MQSSKLNKQFTLLLIIMPILNIYATHFVSALRLGELIGIVYMMYLFAMNSKIKLTNKIYWLAMFYLICISLILTMIINKYSLSDTMVRICRVLFYTYFAFALAPQYWNHKYGAKCYINMSLITSLFVIVQYLILQIFNMYIPFVLPGMNLSTNHPNSASYYKTLQRDFYWYGKSTRPSGLFLEPAHFCEFAVFALIFLI